MFRKFLGLQNLQKGLKYFYVFYENSQFRLNKYFV